MIPRFPQILALMFFLPEELSIQLFGIVLLPYRVLLLVSVIPAIVKLQSERRFCLYDFAMAALTAPLLASMMYNHGFAQGLASGGLAGLEIVGSYFVTRAYLNSLSKLQEFVDCWIILAALVLPVLLAESLLKTYLVHPFIVAVTGLHYTIGDLQNVSAVEGLSRLGLLRAMGPFSHPILCGVAYATFIPYALFVYRGPRRLLSLCVLLIGVATTVSSTGIVMVAIELATCLLLRLAARREWSAPVRVLTLAVVPAGLFLNMMSHRGILTVLSTTLALNAGTGYYRTLIWTFGTQDMWAHPFLGLGYHDWARPAWMPPSVDAYWLVVGLRHGAVAFLLFVGTTVTAFLSLLSLFGRHATYDPVFRDTGAVWLSILFGLGLGGIVVDYWGPMAMLIPIVLGACVSLIAAEERVLRSKGAQSQQNIAWNPMQAREIGRSLPGKAQSRALHAAGKWRS
jgi:hypothetical protein